MHVNLEIQVQPQTHHYPGGYYNNTAARLMES